ncbi:MarR family winged helix-turn-helix transcriptional regulator [Aminobacter sp. P9b]|uniref:hypothetical protein n=1 Tax=Aminobacter sp. P9b TaxID=3133697 RepID=UPI00324C59BE
MIDVISAYYRANQRVLEETPHITVGLLNVLLGVERWGYVKGDRHDPMALEELAANLGVAPTTVSQGMRDLGMVKRGGLPGLDLVNTWENADNHRKKVFGLTTKGSNLMADLRTIFGRS